MRAGFTPFMLVALFAATGAAATPHDSQRLYVNCELGFSLELPFYAPVCDIRLNNINSGATVFLDTGIGDCTWYHDERPLMSYHEWYSLPDYRTDEELLEPDCGGAPITETDRLVFAQEARWLKHMCRKELKDGLYRIVLGGGSAKNGTDQWATLQTTAERYEADLAAFLAMLRSMKRFRTTC